MTGNDLLHRLREHREMWTLVTNVNLTAVLHANASETYLWTISIARRIDVSMAYILDTLVRHYLDDKLRDNSTFHTKIELPSTKPGMVNGVEAGNFAPVLTRPLPAMNYIGHSSTMKEFVRRHDLVLPQSYSRSHDGRTMAHFRETIDADLFALHAGLS